MRPLTVLSLSHMLAAVLHTSVSASAARSSRAGLRVTEAMVWPAGIAQSTTPDIPFSAVVGDGGPEPWIELFNGGDHAVSLAGLVIRIGGIPSLAHVVSKVVRRNITLQPGEVALVFGGVGAASAADGRLRFAESWSLPRTSVLVTRRDLTPDAPGTSDLASFRFSAAAGSIELADVVRGNGLPGTRVEWFMAARGRSVEWNVAGNYRNATAAAAGALVRQSAENAALGVIEQGSPGVHVEPSHKVSPAGNSTHAQCLISTGKQLFVGASSLRERGELVELETAGRGAFRVLTDLNQRDAQVCPFAAVQGQLVLQATDGTVPLPFLHTWPLDGLSNEPRVTRLPPSGNRSHGRTSLANAVTGLVAADLYDGRGERAFFTALGPGGEGPLLGVYERSRSARAPQLPPFLADELDRVVDAGEMTATNVRGVRAVGGRWLMMGASDMAGVFGQELWVMGVPTQDNVGPGLLASSTAYRSTASPKLHGDLVPGPAGSDPSDFVEFSGLVLFAANHHTAGRELWGLRTDSGSSRDELSPAKLVVDCRSHSAAIPCSPLHLTVLSPTLLVFVATSEVAGSELMGATAWDGAPVGGDSWQVIPSTSAAFLIADIDAGPGSSNPEHLTAISGWLYFSAFTATGGRELYRLSENSPVELLWEGVRGSASSNPRDIVFHRSSVYFVADDPGYWGVGELFRLPAPSPSPASALCGIGLIPISAHMCGLRAAGTQLGGAGSQLGAAVEIVRFGPAGGVVVAASAPEQGNAASGRVSLLARSTAAGSLHSLAHRHGGWRLLQVLQLPSAAGPGSSAAEKAAVAANLPGLRMGASLSASGSTLAVGGPGATKLANSVDAQGAVALWSWRDRQKQVVLDAVLQMSSIPGLAAPAAEARFGHSLAMSSAAESASGDITLFVGAPSFESNKGAVVRYTRTALGRWVYRDLLLPAAGETSERWFGWSIAASGNALLVGAPGGPRGRVEYFAYGSRQAGGATSEWARPQGGTGGIFTAPDGAATPALATNPNSVSQPAGVPDRFGYAVHASGRRFVVGAPGAYDRSSRGAGGAAYVFTARDSASLFDEDVRVSKLVPQRAGTGDRSATAVRVLSFGPRPGTEHLQPTPSFLDDDGAQVLVAGPIPAESNLTADRNELHTNPFGAPAGANWTVGSAASPPSLLVSGNVSTGWTDVGVAVFEVEVPATALSQQEVRFQQVAWLRPTGGPGAADGLGASFAADAESGLVVLGAPMDDGRHTTAASEAFAAEADADSRTAAGAVYIAECSAAAVIAASAAAEQFAVWGATAATLRRAAQGAFPRSAGTTAAAPSGVSGSVVISVSIDEPALVGGAPLIPGPSTSTVGGCRPGAFRRWPCSPARPAVCLPCSAGRCPAGTFEATSCTGTADRHCVACALCPAGQYASSPCGVAADTQCSPCPPGGCPSPATGDSGPQIVSDVGLVPFCQRTGIAGSCEAGHTRLPPEAWTGASDTDMAMLELINVQFWPADWAQKPLAPGLLSATRLGIALVGDFGPRDSPCNAGARTALVALHDSTGGTFWRQPWPVHRRQGDPSSDPCSGEWQGVQCDAAGHVVALQLGGAGLFGEMPASWCAAIGQSLRVLDMSNNRVTALPTDFSHCVRLEQLAVGGNRLSGSIQTGIAAAVRAMPMLRTLELRGSGLVGGLPDDLELRAASSGLRIAV